MSILIFLRRFMYVAYYLKTMDWKKLHYFTDYYSEIAKKNILHLWYGMFIDSIKFNVSLIEYFLFDFDTKKKEEKLLWAGTGYMYEYQLKMNPPEYRSVLSDKILFLEKYRAFVKHEYLTLSEIESNPARGEKLLRNSSGKLVLKNSKGQCGRGIKVRDCEAFTISSLVQCLKETNNDLVEAFVVQNRDLMELSPSGLNTVRIITQLDVDNRVHLLGCRLRITVNSPIDNLAAGNIAAPIDLDTGIVSGLGVYSDITKSDESHHPVTGVPILGFQIPFWKETIKLCKAAALTDTRNRSVGWDVAITDKGPELIEGNHDWCKLLWQLPVKRGLKNTLEAFLSEYQNS